MSRFAKIAGFAGALAVLFAAFLPSPRADQIDRPIPEGQGVETELGDNASAITYWVRQPDGWHVVTTVDTVIAQHSNAERHAVVRFEGMLLPGQSQVISVPFAIGERQRLLRIRRLGDQVQVAYVPDPA
jgi:hypothetical protein